MVSRAGLDVLGTRLICYCSSGSPVMQSAFHLPYRMSCRGCFYSEWRDEMKYRFLALLESRESCLWRACCMGMCQSERGSWGFSTHFVEWAHVSSERYNSMAVEKESEEWRWVADRAVGSFSSAVSCEFCLASAWCWSVTRSNSSGSLEPEMCNHQQGLANSPVPTSPTVICYFTESNALSYDWLWITFTTSFCIGRLDWLNSAYSSRLL